jgi:hypothetical protein
MQTALIEPVTDGTRRLRRQQGVLPIASMASPFALLRAPLEHGPGHC